MARLPAGRREGHAFLSFTPLAEGFSSLGSSGVFVTRFFRKAEEIFLQLPSDRSRYKTG